MNIILLFQDDYPWDVRIEKFANSLKQRYHVHLLCRNRSNLPILEENGHNFTIHRLSYNNKLLTEPIHINPIWRKFLDDKIIELNPRTIIVRNLPLAKLAIYLGKKHDIPVVLDNAENYPEYFTTLPKYTKNLLFRAVYKSGYVNKLEEYCIINADAVINVIEENTNRIRAWNNNMIELYNVPTLNREAIMLKDNLNTIKLCYSGGLEADHLRGVSDIIKAMPLLNIKVELHIFGEGQERCLLENMAKSLRLSNVFFHGRIKYEELKCRLVKFDIGIVSHRKLPMTDTTMANKAYEYISYGLAVLTSNAIPLKRFVEENRVGLAYESRNHVSLAKAIEELVKRGLLTNAERKKRYEIHLKKFNWEIEELKLYSLLSDLITSKGN